MALESIPRENELDAGNNKREMRGFDFITEVELFHLPLVRKV